MNKKETAIQKKLILIMMVVLIAITGSGCLDIFKIEVIQTHTPTPIPTPVPVNPEVRTVDITVDYKVESLGIILYDDSYTYRLENTTMTDDEIKVKVDEKVIEVVQDKNIDLDWVSYECLIEVWLGGEIRKMNEEEKEIDDIIDKAKEAVIKRYGYGADKRRWLECLPPDSYDSHNYEVRLFVLEGSPPKGYVVVDYAYGIVKAFGVRFEHIHTWNPLNYPYGRNPI